MMLRALAFFLCALCGPVLAEEVIISGLVLDTASSAANDKPLGGVVVEVRDVDGKVLGDTTTLSNGMFHIRFDDKEILKGKETIQVEASGYSARPTKTHIKLSRAKGVKIADQGTFLLTNNKFILEDRAYREAVTRNAIQTQAESGQGERSRMVFASLSNLPSQSKGIAFESVKGQSAQAFSELVRVDRDVMRTRELESEFIERGSSIVPSYETTGKIRLTGAVRSKNEMDAVIQQAGQKGFRGGTVINHMSVGKQ